MNNTEITNVGYPTYDYSAANKFYVDQEVNGRVYSGAFTSIEVVDEYPDIELAGSIISKEGDYMRLNEANIVGMRLNEADVVEARLNEDIVFSSKPLYKQDGLMALFMGDNKTNASPNKNTWKNLGSGGNFTLLNFAYTGVVAGQVTAYSLIAWMTRRTL